MTIPGPVNEGTAPTRPAPRIEWNRVALYTVAFLVGTFVGGFAGGFLVGFSRGVGAVPPPWTFVVGPVLVAVATVAVFVWIGRVQKTMPAAHAALVWASGNAVGFVLNVILLGMPLQGYFGSAAISGVLAAFGTAVGVFSRRRQPTG